MQRPLRFDGFRPSSEKASRIASRIRSSDSKAETLLRSSVWRLGLRFRKNVRALPGKPDLVFPRERVAVFCDGDFWHGRNWEEKRRKLKEGSNAPYWLSKIHANMQRDERHNSQLAGDGWHVLRFWESDILTDPARAASEVAAAVAERRQNSKGQERAGA